MFFKSLLLICLVVPFSLMAAPTISTVSIGTSTISIGGADFGSKTTAAPLRFDNFESYTVGNNVSSESSYWTDSNAVTNRAKVSNDYAFGGSKSVKAAQANGSDGDDPQFFKNNIGFASTGKAFVSFWVRWKFPVWTGGTTYEALQYKLFRMCAAMDAAGNVTYPSGMSDPPPSRLNPAIVSGKAATLIAPAVISIPVPAVMSTALSSSDARVWIAVTIFVIAPRRVPVNVAVSSALLFTAVFTALASS